MQNKSLICPICHGNKSEMLGKNIKLSGQFEDKEFLTTELTVLRCVKCGYYMLFDNTVDFVADD